MEKGKAGNEKGKGGNEMKALAEIPWKGKWHACGKRKPQSDEAPSSTQAGDDPSFTSRLLVTLCLHLLFSSNPQEGWGDIIIIFTTKRLSTLPTLISVAFSEFFFI